MKSAVVCRSTNDLTGFCAAWGHSKCMRGEDRSCGGVSISCCHGRTLAGERRFCHWLNGSSLPHLWPAAAVTLGRKPARRAGGRLV